MDEEKIKRLLKSANEEAEQLEIEKKRLTSLLKKIDERLDHRRGLCFNLENILNEKGE